MPRPTFFRLIAEAAGTVDRARENTGRRGLYPPACFRRSAWIRPPRIRLRRTAPSTAMRSPGRTTTRSPARTCSTGVSTSAPSRNTRAVGRLQVHQMADGIGSLGRARALQQSGPAGSAQQSQPRLRNRRLIPPRGSTDRIEECRARAQGDQRIHIGGATPQRRPRCR